MADDQFSRLIELEQGIVENFLAHIIIILSEPRYFPKDFEWLLEIDDLTICLVILVVN